MVVRVTIVIQVTWRLGFVMGCHQRRLWCFRNKDRRNRKPKINVITIDNIKVRGKRRQGFGLLGKSFKTLQIIFIVELSEHRILYAICRIQASPSIPDHPVPPTPLVMPSLTIQANPLVLVHSFTMIFQVVLITFDACCSQQRHHGV